MFGCLRGGSVSLLVFCTVFISCNIIAYVCFAMYSHYLWEFQQLFFQRAYLSVFLKCIWLQPLWLYSQGVYDPGQPGDLGKIWKFFHQRENQEMHGNFFRILEICQCFTYQVNFFYWYVLYLLQYNNVAIKQNRENETQVQKKMCDFNKNTCYTQASANSNTCQRV